MIRGAVVALACLAVAIPAVADIAFTSLRPITRAEAEASRAAEALLAAAAIRPHTRPDASATLPVGSEAVAFLDPALARRPVIRPDSVLQDALFGRRKKKRGSVCGDADIQGEKLGKVPGSIRGCGIKNAVSVREVSGVRLSRPATMDCDTAKALNKWVEKGLKPTFRRRGPVVEMKVAAHYACRTRNNQRGAKISEHGRGKAIDISAFTMMDGEVITVVDGWRRGTTRPLLYKAHKSACGPFGTVLGPNADRYHQDHFHFDTARHRGGPYCR